MTSERLVKSVLNWDYMATFETLQTWVGHVAISFSNLNFSHIEVTKG